MFIGCGDDQRARSTTGPQGLRDAIGLTRAAGEVPLRYEERSKRGTRASRVDVTVKGSVDLVADSGEADVEFDGSAAYGLPESWRLRWDARTVTVGDKTLPRARARERGGTLGLLPDHIHAL